MNTLCGLDCNECGYNGSCGGCVATGGRPFGGTCVVGLCCGQKSCKNHGQVFYGGCELMRRIVDEVNSLDIDGLDKIDSLNLLVGSDINIGFTLPSGQKVKFWDDNRVYFGTQVEKRQNRACGNNNSGCTARQDSCRTGDNAGRRYFGLVADEKYLLICEYGENGSDAEIILFMKWRVANENTYDSDGARNRRG